MNTHSTPSTLTATPLDNTPGGGGGCRRNLTPLPNYRYPWGYTISKRAGFLVAESPGGKMCTVLTYEDTADPGEEKSHVGAYQRARRRF
jgi:hypothetical protein